MRRLSLVLCAVALLAAACGGGGPTVGASKVPSKPCPSKIPFAAGYLPPGFTNQLQSGPASGQTSLKNVAIFHYNGGGGQYIEVLRGGKRSPLNGTAPMIVLNHLARIGPVPHGYAINFRLAAQRCGTFQIVGANFPKPDELVKVGHGLKAAPA